MLTPNPLEQLDLDAFAARLRAGDISSEAATAAYLARIAALDPRLCAFVHVAGEAALDVARGIDLLLRGGTDLGPLMGVPVVVKELFTVAGMPLPRVGSDLDVHDLIEAEGTFVKALKRAGCVILGTARMTEFAFGLVNLRHPTPWNPWDSREHRMPGGSSSGSAVALAAGMCAFSVGSDTGGSVRHPAALCGLFGFKPTEGLWPTDGVFPLSSTFDSIGTFTRSAHDAAQVFAALTAQPLPAPRALAGLRLARPRHAPFDELSDDVSRAFDAALERLRGAGVEIVAIDVPEAAEVDDVFLPMVPAELLAHLGADRIATHKEVLDPMVQQRFEPAMHQSADRYIALRHRQRALCRIAEARMQRLDGWVTATSPDTAVRVADFDTVDTASAWVRRGLRNTRPANLFGQCAVSLPLPLPGAALPVGLQVIGGAGCDAPLLSIAQGIENLLGRAPHADTSAFE
ncbi:MAG TPA: amidase [Casimicrobiaceae bacterium]|jgi:aspartyl-tRNA(Asn)/glutamyl-tRNA(Gln) amidotransferase subunit A